ncbi:WxL protein peptidoglycan domain-containing protein [Xylocopilactobacillus apis]|uniref:Cell surface protein n=1 Tax=Xylocopilactobacillus apis TaxID=2932183 RepID=A0AAU9DG06_9LACO|nr:DUF916 domain-containing protein [Xylocopilactobacillus apis]BDR55647.1 hypothetical protein KIMC2_02090 [Xylocopilactobacillus apis]
MKKVKSFPLFLIIALVFVVNFSSVNADITNVSVTPQIDSGDTDKFEMVVKPGEKRTLTIAFTNFGSAVERLTIQPTNAQTDATGNFVYNEVIKKGTDGLQAAFADMTSKKTITLQPQQSKTETLTVSTPNDRFDGVIYGGLNIYSVNADGGHLNGESTPIPVIITQTNENVPGNGKVTGIEAQAISYQPNIVINLVNNKPGEARNVSYNLMIQRKGMFSFLGFNGRKVPVYQSDLTIAPNSTLPIPVNFKQQPLKAGEYMVTGSFTVNGKTHKVNETYKLSKSDVEKVNKQSKGLIYDKTWIFVLVIIGLIILIGIVIFLIVRQIRYNRREENNRLVAESDKILKSEQTQESKSSSKSTPPQYGQSNVQNNQRGTNQNPYQGQAPNSYQNSGQMPYNQPLNYQNPYPNNGNFQQNNSMAPNQRQNQPINNQSIPNYNNPSPSMGQNANQGQFSNGRPQQVNPNYGNPQNQGQPPVYGSYPNQQAGMVQPNTSQNNFRPNQSGPNNFVQPVNGNNVNPLPNQYYGQTPNNLNSQQMNNNSLNGQGPGLTQNQNFGNQPKPNSTNNSEESSNQQDSDWDQISLDDLMKKH